MIDVQVFAVWQLMLVPTAALASAVAVFKNLIAKLPPLK
jgi:hypothetical protein